jgi:hypothetical protein
MTISRAARGTKEEEADRDTVELSSEDLSRLRSLDDDGSDRDTIEISASEALRLAQSRGEPGGEASAEGSATAEQPAPPARSGEMPVPVDRKTLDEVELEGSDRTALHTIPAPPTFDEET